jgi:hypothetical protein
MLHFWLTVLCIGSRDAHPERFRLTRLTATRFPTNTLSQSVCGLLLSHL